LHILLIVFRAANRCNSYLLLIKFKVNPIIEGSKSILIKSRFLFYANVLLKTSIMVE